MKLDQIEAVNTLFVERKHLLRLIEAASSDGVFSIVVAVLHEPQDEAMAALVRPHVVTELRARLAQLDAELKRFGVVIT